MGVEWVGGAMYRRSAPRPVRRTNRANVLQAEMVIGTIGEFCIECGQLAFCPECGEDLRGKTKCHLTISTHYRDSECKYNPNATAMYARKDNK